MLLKKTSFSCWITRVAWHGKKVEQAKEALRYCVQNLNDGDRFNLILFNTDITSLADRLNRREEWLGGERAHHSAALSHQLIDVKDGREKAFAFIEGIEGRALTNINDALLTALKEKPDPDRPRIIAFLTDGCPTAGVTNEAQDPRKRSTSECKSIPHLCVRRGVRREYSFAR